MIPTAIRGLLPAEKAPAEDYVATMRKLSMSGGGQDVKGGAKSINPSELLAYSSFDYLKNMAVEVAIRLDGRAERSAADRILFGESIRNWPSSHPVFLHRPCVACA